MTAPDTPPPPATVRHVLWNWVWLVGTQVLVRLVAFGYKVFLARALHAEGYGVYAWVLAVIALGTMAAELGFNRLLIRDIARDPARGPALLGAVARFRVIAAAVVYVGILLMCRVVPTGPVHQVGLLIAGLTLVVSAAGQTFDAGFYGIEQARFSGVSQLLVTVLAAVFGAGALLAGFGLPGVFVGVTVAEVGRTVYLYARLGRFGLRPQWRASEPVWPLVRDTVPYALLGVLNVIYFRIDTVMLTPLRGDAETGIYTVAFKLFEVLLFVPGTLAAVVLPRMARYHDDDMDRLRASHVRLSRLLFGVAVPISAALWIAAPTVITVAFGVEYASSAPVLRLLAVTFLFYCLHVPNGAVVLSGTVLTPIVWLSLGTTLFNVVLNAYYIPAYGALAAAGTTLASEILSWAVFTVFIHVRIVPLHGWLGAMARPAAATIGAAGVVFLLARWPVAACGGGLLAYAAGCVAWGVVRREDWALLRGGEAHRVAPPESVDLG